MWACGSDKSPGPDGFTFAFYKRYWELLKGDVMNFVGEFFQTGKIPSGCNSSFIRLIPKVASPMVVTDFRPISLIGGQYKIMSKLLTLRLAPIMNSIISLEQSAFVKGRQILDGPLMVNEIVDWCKKRKKKLMVFKVDFEKAYDTINWDYLCQMMIFLDFGSKCIDWIRGCLFSAKA